MIRYTYKIGIKTHSVRVTRHLFKKLFLSTPRGKKVFRKGAKKSLSGHRAIPHRNTV
jgi:hemoglobin-like flavoprotein